MTVQILDYSAGYPGATNIKAAGYGGVIRYLRKEGTSRVRPITAAELADMRAHGLAVALVYQAISTARVLEGGAAGANDARWALAQGAAIGVPNPRAIYFAADQDIDAAELPRVLAYLDGAASVLGRGRVGIYGEASVVDAAVPGHATYGWQTAAWSGGRRSADAHLYQRIGQPVVGGIACDVNDVLKPDFGQIDMEDDMTPQELLGAPLHNPLWSGEKVNVEDVLRSAQGHAADANHKADVLLAKLDALAGALSDDEANIIAAFRTSGGAGITPEEHAAILAKVLPGAVVDALVQMRQGS